MKIMNRYQIITLILILGILFNVNAIEIVKNPDIYWISWNFARNHEYYLDVYEIDGVYYKNFSNSYVCGNFSRDLMNVLNESGYNSLYVVGYNDELYKSVNIGHAWVRVVDENNNTITEIEATTGLPIFRGYVLDISKNTYEIKEVYPLE